MDPTDEAVNEAIGFGFGLVLNIIFFRIIPCAERWVEPSDKDFD